MTLHLTVSLAGSGYHPAAWRISRLPPAPNAAAFQAMAHTAERAKLAQSKPTIIKAATKKKDN